MEVSIMVVLIKPPQSSCFIHRWKLLELGRGINFMYRYRYYDHVSSITVKKEWNQPFVSNNIQVHRE